MATSSKCFSPFDPGAVRKSIIFSTITVLNFKAPTAVKLAVAAILTVKLIELQLASHARETEIEKADVKD